MDYTKLKVSEIKQMLIDEDRFTAENLAQLDIKGKGEWVDLHRQTSKTTNEDDYVWDIQNELDNIIEIDVDKNNDPPIIQKDPDVPHYKDPEWNDYVMAQFAPAELIDGKYPNVNALRRVTELLLGNIVFSGPIEVKTTLDAEHTGKAVIVYQVTIDWTLDAFYDGGIGAEGYPQRSFSAVASSYVGNTDDMYAVFAESIAETRAEGRALRRALRLNVVCADELTNKDTAAIVQQQKNTVATTGEWEEDSLISDAQINTITTLCNRLGIDILKFINSGSKTYGEIGKVTKAAAAGMMQQLNKYQSSGADSLDIPLNLIGE